MHLVLNQPNQKKRLNRKSKQLQEIALSLYLALYQEKDQLQKMALAALKEVEHPVQPLRHHLKQPKRRA
jgi:hypothetical protein